MADPYVGRLAYVRVYSGVLRSGGTIWNSAKERRERIGRLLRMHANDREEVDALYAGGIGAAVGLKQTFTGDTLCDPDAPVLLEGIAFPEPVISVALEPRSKADQERMADSLQKLSEEDPTFHWRFNDETGQTIISGMGELHLEVIVDRMKREHRVEANVGRPQVSYREAIRRAAAAEGRFVRQTGGRGQFGVVELEIEPGERGDGFVFENRVVGGSVPIEYVSAVRAGAQEALDSGPVAGYPVLDVRVALTDGASHAVDSSELAFKNAAILGMREALKRAGPVLLEPLMRIEVRVPEDHFGGVVGDLNSRRGHVVSQDTMGRLQIVTATVPLAQTFGYSTDLRSLTQGRATSTMEFDRYEAVPQSVSATLVERAAVGAV